MYSYSFDNETGGLLLNSSPTNFSKEPRPVYAPEMDLLNFNNFWDYDSANIDEPYLWAESNVYWYRGEQIAKLKGGSLYIAPELIPARNIDGEIVHSNKPLLPINIKRMCEKNSELMNIVISSTVKKIIKEYEKFKNKLDIFHVAFSGGKDSAVLLDLVKKSLPAGSFVVIFGDTGMEFPDTYHTVNVANKLCAEQDIPFYIAKSHFTPEQSWKIFGPPARVLRWCCSVHKSTPQTLLMRKLTGKDNYVGLDFVGVRKHESLARSTYEYENFGKKQRGQYSYNPILDWTSAEIWLYIFSNNLYVNPAYKKGNSRAGCLCCPMSNGTSDFFRYSAYKKEIDTYIGYIKESYVSTDPDKVKSYITNGGWNARNNGRNLKDNASKLIELTGDNVFTIKIMNPTTSWNEWIKTLGSCFSINDTDYIVKFEGKSYQFSVFPKDNGYDVVVSNQIVNDSPKFAKHLKQVFRKACYCVCCQVCETNCRNGCIKFVNGDVQITDCVHCLQCHSIDSGCLLFHSLRQPQGGGRHMKSLNSFADHAPKRDWLVMFFEMKEDFFTYHSLGPMMYDMFRRFLKDAGLNEKNHFTPFAELISNLGWESPTALGLMLVNLAMENPQIEWYIKNLSIDMVYERSHVEDMLINNDVKPKDAKSICKAFKRIVETPFGTNLNFGYVTSDDCMVRTKCIMDDNRVLLYALYKFAEKCNMDKEFNVSYLLNNFIERNTVTPVQIFGLDDYDELKSKLLGLSSAYPNFINATFTNDLKTVTLRDKTSLDVLDLFREEN